ncbi:hypothetical protein BT69DRAFT_1358107 [Atractiella rhizophila]|nr:hypothetical protein BT69DRAFT_1358107 [Atractiella rhizophila]
MSIVMRAPSQGSNPYHLPHLAADDKSGPVVQKASDAVAAYHLPRAKNVSTSTAESTQSTSSAGTGEKNVKAKKTDKPPRKSSILQKAKQFFRPDSEFKKNGNGTNNA